MTNFSTGNFTFKTPSVVENVRLRPGYVLMFQDVAPFVVISAVAGETG